jgi:hypothetical protein
MQLCRQETESSDNNVYCDIVITVIKTKRNSPCDVAIHCNYDLCIYEKSYILHWSQKLFRSRYGTRLQCLNLLKLSFRGIYQVW